MPRKRICSCGNIVNEYEKCPCKKVQRKPKAEIERNKDLTTTKWKKFRMQIIARDGAHCKHCVAKYNLITASNLQVHHIKPRIEYPELMYEASNCVTLCRRCNTEYGTVEQLDFAFTPKELENYNL
jgi:5-methylcytosine-specific restriction endonuclease McrA